MDFNIPNFPASHLLNRIAKRTSECPKDSFGDTTAAK